MYSQSKFVNTLFLAFTLVLFFFVSALHAAPNTVRLEIAGLGIDDGNPNSPFSLPLNSNLSSGGQYKILIAGRDTDTDNNNQPVNNLTFDIAITNGSIAAFEWLVQGDIDDANFSNSIPGIDNPGQVSTDTFSGHSFPTQNLINAGFASPLPVAVVYFVAGSAGVSINVDLDSNPFVSGFATDNSHYGVNGTSYSINQGQGLSFVGSIGASGVTPTPTQASTGTATRTRTPTASPTIAGPTGTPTRTATHTATRTITQTPTRSATPTISRTPTITSTPTISRTPTITSTPTPPPPPLLSPTPTPTSGPSSGVSLSGKILFEGFGLGGVSVDGGSLGVVLTDSNGEYRFNDLSPNTVYSITPVLSGYVFTPSSVCGIVSRSMLENFEGALLGKVYPKLECVSDNGDGTHTARFGYLSGYASAFDLPLGNKNKFKPAAKDRNQPTTFLPGRVFDYFAVKFSSNEITWNLQNSTVTASQSSPACCNGVVDQCGVCNGDGASCESCNSLESLASIEKLSLVTRAQLENIIKIKKVISKKANAVIASSKLNRRIKAAHKLAAANNLLIQAFSRETRSCNASSVCNSLGLCERVKNYKANSEKLLKGGIKLQKLSGPSTRIQSELTALHQDNLNAVDAIPLLKSNCGE